MQEPVTPEDRFAIKHLLARFSWAIVVAAREGTTVELPSD
jgi:hypothetical protein